MIGNKTVVYTAGTFDMLHANHLKMLEYIFLMVLHQHGKIQGGQ